jgi:hypothetical protein
MPTPDPEFDRSPLDAEIVAVNVFLHSAAKRADRYRAGLDAVRLRAALVMLSLSSDALEELFATGKFDADLENIAVRQRPRGTDDLVAVCEICDGEDGHNFDCELSELRRALAAEFQGEQL